MSEDFSIPEGVELPNPANSMDNADVAPLPPLAIPIQVDAPVSDEAKRIEV